MMKNPYRENKLLKINNINLQDEIIETEKRAKFFLKVSSITSLLLTLCLIYIIIRK